MNDQITAQVIGCANKVAMAFGTGFPKKVYENALAHEMRKNGLHVKQQSAIHVLFDGIVVGEYVSDLLVEKNILVELKAVKALDTVHTAQCMNYLRAPGLKGCLLINFGTSMIEVKRMANNFQPSEVFETRINGVSLKKHLELH